MAEHVDPVATLRRGARPSRRASGEHDFITPSLPTPAIARLTVWTGSQQSVQEILAGVEALEDGIVRKELSRRVLAARQFLAWLAAFPGETWQQRWLASGADTAGRAWTDLPDASGATTNLHTRRAEMTGAAGRLILLDAIRPSYVWLYSAPSNTLYHRFGQLRDPAGFAALEARCEANKALTISDRRNAFTQLARILMHNGGRLADITVTDCVEAYRAQTAYTNARQHSLWYALLREEGVLSADAPPSIFAASRRGQLTIEEIVDGYSIACRPVRDMFVDYLHERQPGLDYKTIRQLATKLVLLFWKDLELHHAGIDSLHLSDTVARSWKQRLRHVRYGNHKLGQEREDPYTILMAVRALYADVSHWALEDPARWAQWAAPSPVDSRDLAGMTKAAKRRQSRMHQRIRELAPLLPCLVDAAAARRSATNALLAAAKQVAPGEVFTATGQTLRRTALASDPELGGDGRPGVIYATAPDGTGPRRNLVREDERAFWAWACVEVFRHTGVRIEEMLEITHRSFVSYSLPTTREVIPMLQITPSKTDKERLLVISPELANAFAQIIHRVRDGHEHVPLVTRYDHAERLHSAPLPFLFQRRWGLNNIAITHARVKELLDELVAAAAITNPDGTRAAFSPHDFRRIFATEAVASGLPVHIAAKILGHASLATTQTYINPRELHQAGRECAGHVVMAGSEWHSGPSTGGPLTWAASLVSRSDAGSARQTGQPAGGSLFKRTEEGKGRGGRGPTPPKAIQTVPISDSAISRLRPGRDRPPPRVYRPAAPGSPQRGVPGTHRQRMGRVPRPFRQTQDRTRHLWTRLRHQLPTRTRLYPLLDAPPRPNAT